MRTYISMIYRAFKQCGLWLRLRVAASHGDPHITRIPLIFKLSKRLVAVTPFRLLAALECKCYSLCGIQITVTSFTIRTTIIIKYKNANFVDFIMALTFVWTNYYAGRSETQAGRCPLPWQWHQKYVTSYLGITLTSDEFYCLRAISFATASLSALILLFCCAYICFDTENYFFCLASPQTVWVCN